MPGLAKNPAAYFIEYRDGLRATLLMLNGAVCDYCFSARVDGYNAPLSTQFFLSPTPNVTYSACLVHNIVKMIDSGSAPYPPERTLIVCGILEACLTSRLQGGRRLETPDIDVKYLAPAESHHARA